MNCPYVQPEWYCEKQAGHDGPHEMWVGELVTSSRTEKQSPASLMTTSAPTAAPTSSETPHAKGPDRP